MRIALLFVVTLGAGLALGLDAADASSRQQQPQSQTVSVEVPTTPENSGGPIEVQPVRWRGELQPHAQRPAPFSSWSPGPGDLVLAAAAIGTLGTGVLVRRRVLVPVRR